MNQNSIRTFSIAAVLVLVSAAASAQEATAPAAATNEATETATVYDAYLLSKTDRLELRMDAGDALRRAHATAGLYNDQDAAKSRYQLMLRLDKQQQQLDAQAKEIAELKEKNKKTFATLSGGYILGLNGGDSAMSGRVVLDGVLGLYGEYVAGYGLGLGLAGVSTQVGPVKMRFLGVGWQTYSNDKNPMFMKADPRSGDLKITPAEFNVLVWKGLGVGARASLLLPSPSVAYDRAEKVINGKNDANPGLGIDPTTIDPNDPNALGNLQQQGQNALNNQVNSQVDNATSKGEEAVTQMGKVYGDALKFGWQLTVNASWSLDL